MNDYSLREMVDSFIEKMRVDGTQLIPAPFVAKSIVATFPHAALFSKVEYDAAYGGVVQVARSLLRQRHDEDYSPEKLAQGGLNLPEAQYLNGSYSVKRDDEYLYVPRFQFERSDMEYVCAQYDHASAYAALCSRAVRADFERRNSAAA